MTYSKRWLIGIIISIFTWQLTPAAAQDWPDPVLELVAISSDASSYQTDKKIKFTLTINRLNGSQYSDVTRVWFCPATSWDNVSCSSGQQIATVTPPVNQATFTAETLALTLADGNYIVTAVSFRNGTNPTGFTLTYGATNVVTISGIRTTITPINLSPGNFTITTPVPEPEPEPQPEPEPDPTNQPTSDTESTTDTESNTSDTQATTTDTATTDITTTGTITTETESTEQTSEDVQSPATDDSAEQSSIDTEVSTDITADVDNEESPTEAVDEAVSTDTTNTGDAEITGDSNISLDVSGDVPSDAEVESTDSEVTDPPISNQSGSATETTTPPSNPESTSQPIVTPVVIPAVVPTQPIVEVKPVETSPEPEIVISVQPSQASATQTPAVETTEINTTLTKPTMTKLLMPKAFGGSVMKVSGEAKLIRKVSAGNGKLRILKPAGISLQFKLGNKPARVISGGSNAELIINWWSAKPTVLRLKVLANSAPVLLDALQLNGRLITNPTFLMRE